MLVLTRRPGESIRIGSDVRITVVASTGGQVRVAIDAPTEVGIFREEIFERVASANVEAASMANSILKDLVKPQALPINPSLGGKVNV